MKTYGRSERPAIARPTTSSECPNPYWAAVSIQFTPSSSARWMAATDSSSSCAPQLHSKPPPPSAQAPKPTRVISIPVEPNGAVLRSAIAGDLATREGIGPRRRNQWPMMLEERDLVEDAADRWWLFLLTGITWLIVALIIFQWNYTTVYAVSFLFGFIAIFAGINEFVSLGVSSAGWKIVHVILGVLFVLAGIWALVHPHNAFATLAGLIGFFLLFKGIFDLMAAFIARGTFELWWLQLVVGIIEILLAFWIAGSSSTR